MHSVDKQNATLLHAACGAGNLPAAQYLNGQGLSLTALTSNKETLLHLAVLSGNKELIQWLIETQQIDINARNTWGETALDRVARRNEEVVELLVRNGAETSFKNSDTQPPDFCPDDEESAPDALFIAGKLPPSKLTGKRALFFPPQSTSEEKIAKIEHPAATFK
ncbi:ankyrin repeat domain-containing protein [Legionella adelaidensis]|uniref:ankyrin repeat domain-containing protein n=1 Tax=Legionella adelaidensis TaxID=45056 RepID=UPI0016628038|nr:ankyrin repeat domain-containing protein [Legionella adelaidensis]